MRRSKKTSWHPPGLYVLLRESGSGSAETLSEVNASIDGDDVVYHNYFDVSMAVSTPRGLVTPVLRDVDLLGMADIEKNIKELAVKGRDGKLTVDDLTGGNLHYYQRRRLRLPDVHADHQPTAERYSGYACH